MIRLTKLVFAFSFVAGVAACGGGGGDLSASEAIHESITRTCEKAFECEAEFDGGGFITFEELYGTSVDDCITMFEAASADLEASVEAGRIAYDSADAEACLDGTDFGTCQMFFERTYQTPAACDTTFVGTVPEGGECVTSDDCADDNATCDGVCIIPA